MKPLVVIIAAIALVMGACTTSDGTDEPAPGGDPAAESTVAESTAPDATVTETTTAATPDPAEGRTARVAATVGGLPISVDEVEGLRYDTSLRLTASEFAQHLGAVIQWRVIEQAAVEQFDFDPAEDELGAAFDDLLLEFGGGADLDGFLEAQNLSEDVLRQSARQVLIRDTVRDALSGDVDEPSVEEAEEAHASRPVEWTTVCVAHILVPTQEEAAGALERIRGGEDFAAVAEEVSIDPGSGAEGGDLGCTSAADFVPEFSEATMTAEIGEITEPVETQFGFHIIRVDGRELATATEVRQRMREDRIESAVSDWYLDTLAAAEVTVVREFGTWMQTPTPHVEPP